MVGPDFISDAHRIAREVRIRVGQGVYRPGDELPPIGGTSEEQLINPHRVREAYAYMCDEGVVVDFGDDRYVVTAEGPALARAWLRAQAQAELIGAVRRYKTWGLTREEIVAMAEQAVSKEEDA